MAFGERRRALMTERASLRQPLSLDVSEYDDFGTVPDNVPPVLVSGYPLELIEDFRPRGIFAVSRLVTVSSFPYTPTTAEMESDFSVGSESPGRDGSRWAYGTLTAPRVGTNPDAWALTPAADYAIGTVSWLVSPAFDFSGLSGSGFFLEWLLWLRADATDALKVQVSQDSGATWFDVTNTAAYNALSTGLLTDAYGGGDDGWGGLPFGGPSPARIGVDIAPFEGVSDVRFRFGFASGSASLGQAGAVIDGISVGTPVAQVLTDIEFAVQPSDVNVDTVFSPDIVVAAIDQFGFVIPTLNAGTVDISILNDPSVPGPAVLGGTLTQSWVNGFATFDDLEIDDREDGFTLEASAAAGSILRTSDPFDVLQGFLQFDLTPTAVGASLDFGIVIGVYDNLGAPDTAFTGPVTLTLDFDPTGSATLSGTVVVNAVAGLATFTDLEIDLAGTAFLLRATSPGLDDVVSAGIDVFFLTQAALTFGSAPLAQRKIEGQFGLKSQSISFQKTTTAPFAFGSTPLSESMLPFNVEKDFRFPLQLDDLHLWTDADEAFVTTIDQGPYWVAAPSHERGVLFDGSTNYIFLGDTGLYDHTAVAMTITALIYYDSTSDAGTIYDESRSGSGSGYLLFRTTTTDGQFRFAINKDDASNTTDDLFGTSMATGWHVVTLVLDPTGANIYVDGTGAGHQAFDSTLGLVSHDQADIGAFRRNSNTDIQWSDTIAYMTRHAATLTEAEIRQVQQHIADQVAADIDLTIVGGEAANSNSPFNEYKFEEDTGTTVVDSAGATDGTLINDPQWSIRGVVLDGDDDYVDLGAPLYDDTDVGMAVTIAFFVKDPDAQPSTQGTLYSEGAAVGTNTFRWSLVKNTQNAQFDLRDGTGTATFFTTLSAAFSNVGSAWNISTLNLDAAGVGWGFVTNGTERKALGTAYDNPPATTTLATSQLGSHGQGTSSLLAGMEAFVIRHDKSLSLAEIRQVQQYIADILSGDGLVMPTIVGGESGNSNGPLNEYPFDENTGTLAADNAGSEDGTLVNGARFSPSRGVDFDGVDDYIELGTPLYDDTAPAVSYTVLAYIDASAQAATASLYAEGRDAGGSPQLKFRATNTAGRLAVVLLDDSNTQTINNNVNGAVTDEAWSVITLVLDDAGTGWGMIVNGTEVQALGTAYGNAPGTTTLDNASFGAHDTNGAQSNFFAGPEAYATRHTSALTLAQVRQLHQHIADEVAADGIALTIAGGESANANSPFNEYTFDEGTGTRLVDSGLASVGTLTDGPLWAKEEFQRGLDFAPLGSNLAVPTAIIDDTDPAATITVLARITDEATDKFLYSEDDAGGAGGQTMYFRSNNVGQIRVLLRSTTTDTINQSFAAFTDGEWAVFTLVLDDAGGGWGFVVDGTEAMALGTAYDNAPATYSFILAVLGADLGLPDGIAYAIRHDSALSLAEIRQVQQHIADEVAGEISVTIAGGEPANANTPQDEWPLDETDDTPEAANIGSASTVGVRRRGTTTLNIDDRSGNDDDAVQAVAADQPRFLADSFGFAGGTPGINSGIDYDGVDDDMVAIFATGGAVTQPFIIALPYKCDLWAAGAFLFDGDDGVNSVSVYETGGNIVIDAGGTPRIIGTIAELQGTHVLICVLDGVNSKVYLDGGASKISASPGTNIIDGLTFAADNAGANNLACMIGDGIVNDAALIDGDIDGLGDDLAGTAGTLWTPII